MTIQSDIAGWFDRGVAQGATHMIVVCDTFDYEEYPVFVSAGQDAREISDGFNRKNMQHVMEVYNLQQDKAAQLKERRAFNF